jgi:hypothetical protein
MARATWLSLTAALLGCALLSGCDAGQSVMPADKAGDSAGPRVLLLGQRQRRPAGIPDRPGIRRRRGKAVARSATCRAAVRRGRRPGAGRRGADRRDGPRRHVRSRLDRRPGLGRARREELPGAPGALPRDELRAARPRPHEPDRERDARWAEEAGRGRDRSSTRAAAPSGRAPTRSRLAGAFQASSRAHPTLESNACADDGTGGKPVGVGNSSVVAAISHRRIDGEELSLANAPGGSTRTANVTFFAKAPTLFASRVAYEQLSHAQRKVLREAAKQTLRHVVARRRARWHAPSAATTGRSCWRQGASPPSSRGRRGRTMRSWNATGRRGYSSRESAN